MNCRALLALLAGLALPGTASLFGATPSISYFTPTVGTPGDSITIYGTGFTTPGLGIYFWHNVAVQTRFVNSDIQLTVTVPAGTTAGPLQIIGSGSFTTNDFVVVGSGPYITGVTPGYAATNSLVVIDGVHFAGTTTTGVKFNGVASKDAGVNAAGTQINVHVPYGATSGPLIVTSGSGSFTNPTSFTVVGPGPFVADFSPTAGPAGSTLLIDGLHFATATGAIFNGQPGTNFSVRSDTLIQVDAPPGVMSGPIAITSPQGIFTTSSNFFVPPIITSFSPSSGYALTTVRITGSSFLGATDVKIGGASASFIVTNNTTIGAVVPVGASSGLIRVTAPAGSAFSATAYGVQPTIFGFSPSAGTPGSTITITGANLNEGLSAVKFNNVTASFDPPAFGQVTARVPATTTGPITVTTTNGSFTTATNFFLPAAIRSFSPSNSAPGSIVTLNGTNFLGATTVSFVGGATVAPFVTNNNLLGVIVPAGVITGPISITTPAGSSSSSAVFYGAPAIFAFSPSDGLPGTVVTVTGTNLLGTLGVKFNNLDAASTNVLDNGHLQAAVPVGAQSGPITVTGRAGTILSTSSFVLDYTSDLGLAVSAAPAPLPLGSSLTYTIVVTNAGPYSAPNVWLTNWLPTGVTLTSASTSRGDLAANGNIISGALGPMAPNSIATIILAVMPQPTENLTNLTAVGSDFVDPGQANNTATLVTAMLPQLSLKRAANNVVSISWLTNFSSYALQYKSVLTTNTTWTNVSTTRIVSITNYVVTEATTNPARYYRLKK